MSWRDSASGSSSYGVGGNLGNTGVGSGAGAGSMGGGNKTGNYGGTGLTTGKTTYGNTAFGPAGGNAIGNAMGKFGPGFGMLPTMNNYSQFKTPQGQPMFAGTPAQGMSFNARNANQAYGMGQAVADQYRSAHNPAGAAAPDVTTQPVNPVPAVAPPPKPNWYGKLQAYKSPYGPEYAAMSGQSGMGAFNGNIDQWHNYYGGQPGNASYDRGYSGGNIGNIGGAPAPGATRSITASPQPDPGGYATGGVVRSALKTAKDIGGKGSAFNPASLKSLGAKYGNAIVIDGKGHVVHASGTLKSGPIVQAMPDGTMKKGMLTITWES